MGERGEGGLRTQKKTRSATRGHNKRACNAQQVFNMHRSTPSGANRAAATASKENVATVLVGAPLARRGKKKKKKKKWLRESRDVLL
jgi:hypothetical protein